MFLLFCWVSYLPQWCYIRNIKNHGPFVIFITYVFRKLRIKTTTMSINQQHRKSYVLPIIVIQFQRIKVLKYVCENMPWYAPTLRKFYKTGDFYTSLSTTRPNCVILIRYDIHSKLFFSIPIIYNFILRKINDIPNTKRFSFALNYYNATNRFAK